METKPDTIHISTTQSEEIQATHADLIVTIKGSSFFSGDEALKKSKEVNQLVKGVVGLGLAMEEMREQLLEKAIAIVQGRAKKVAECWQAHSSCRAPSRLRGLDEFGQDLQA